MEEFANRHQCVGFTHRFVAVHREVAQILDQFDLRKNRRPDGISKRSAQKIKALK